MHALANGFGWQECMQRHLAHVFLPSHMGDPQGSNVATRRFRLHNKSSTEVTKVAMHVDTWHFTPCGRSTKLANKHATRTHPFTHKEGKTKLQTAATMHQNAPSSRPSNELHAGWFSTRCKEVGGMATSAKVHTTDGQGFNMQGSFGKWASNLLARWSTVNTSRGPWRSTMLACTWTRAKSTQVGRVAFSRGLHTLGSSLPQSGRSIQMRFFTSATYVAGHWVGD